MGCDIHVHLEQWIPVNGVECWKNVDYWRRNPYYGPDMDPEDHEREFEVVSVFHKRDYGLFALLADVRNYQDYEPIDQPRGIPEDADSYTRASYDWWEGDAHSASYFTLEELVLALDRAGIVEYSGMVPPEFAKALDEEGTTPMLACACTTDPTWVHRTWHEPSPLAALVDAIQARVLEDHYAANADEERKTKILANAAVKWRIVFWFDN